MNEGKFQGRVNKEKRNHVEGLYLRGSGGSDHEGEAGSTWRQSYHCEDDWLMTDSLADGSDTFLEALIVFRCDLE
ncbi:hypothetical protein E2C01_092414 [Portunus trituberculatus]|uniref:Uncharacterized protein n=1 Tax=Portunus trituberculatus TaxID=210409 RepID=A0A5B7JGE2_PORTR|nr:hypothetical protein [Portunus trituberculatus]